MQHEGSSPKLERATIFTEKQGKNTLCRFVHKGMGWPKSSNKRNCTRILARRANFAHKRLRNRGCLQNSPGIGSQTRKGSSYGGQQCIILVSDEKRRENIKPKQRNTTLSVMVQVARRNPPCTISKKRRKRGRYYISLALRQRGLLLGPRSIQPYSSKIFRHIRPDVDMSASPGNTKLLKFVARWPHHEAFQHDALSCPLTETQ